jgi:hypothetical protein
VNVTAAEVFLYQNGILVGQERLGDLQYRAQQDVSPTAVTSTKIRKMFAHVCFYMLAASVFHSVTLAWISSCSLPVRHWLWRELHLECYGAGVKRCRREVFTSLRQAQLPAPAHTDLVWSSVHFSRPESAIRAALIANSTGINFDIAPLRTVSLDLSNLPATSTYSVTVSMV